MKNKRPKRILIAGYEIGGQMQLLAETFRKRGIEATAVAFNEDFRGYQNDIRIGLRQFAERLFFLLFALSHYDVFHFFWGVSLLSFRRFHWLDLPILRWRKKMIVQHFRGGDIVNGEYYQFLRTGVPNPSQFIPPVNRPDQLAKIKTWQKYAHHILVSTPDLMQYVPGALLSPQVIDLSIWKSEHQENGQIKGKTITIVHAPSNRLKKGTEFIEQAVSNLIQKGFDIELRLAHNIPANSMKAFYAGADIGVDQLLLGWYGKAACEMMALKIPVVCYIKEELNPYQEELPLINANPQSIEKVLEDLILSETLRQELGQKVYQFVSKFHDVEVVANKLLELYQIKPEDKTSTHQ